MTLAQLVALRGPIAPAQRASARRQRAPRLPIAAERQYRIALQRFVGELEESLRRHVLPAIGARVDELRGKALEGFILMHRDLARATTTERLMPVIHTTERRVNELSRAEMLRVMGVDIGDVPEVATVRADFRQRNVELIRGVGDDFLDRVERTLEETDGQRIEDISARLVNDLDVTRSRADLIAIDQVLKLNGQLNETRQTEAGVVEYVWTTSHDERVRREHRDLDGTTQSWEEPPVSSEDGRREHPGQDYRCRCVATPVIPEFDE